MKRVFLVVLVLALLAGCGQPAARQLPKEPAVFDGSGIVWRQTPDSTCFSWIGYDSQFEKLAVIFRNSEARVYVYSDFTAEDWRDFTDADSLGTYYNTYIKGQFPSTRYDDADFMP